MNLSSLDANLRNLTKKEQEYQQGIRSNFWSQFPTEIRDGKTIYKIFINRSRENDICAIPNSLFVRKHSRFQACPLHIHKWVEINYMYSGTCAQIINEETLILKENQMIFIDSDTPHSVGKIGENDIMISLLIDKNYLNMNFFSRLAKGSILSQFFIDTIVENTSDIHYILFHSQKSRRIPIFLREFLCECYDPSLNSTDMLKSLFNLILSELINVYENDLGKCERKGLKGTIIPILRYIEGNFRTCSLESTAAFFNLNANYLTTLLKQNTGYSYKELVQMQRFKSSEKLLANTNTPVSVIANQVGYENVSFFYKKFKEAYGCSPKEYRMKHRS